ncbi:MAG: hypothetical protein ABW131_01790, partial [Candidatus Sedimenticola sp. 6PFRAG5]
AQQTTRLLEQKVAERTKSINLLQRLGSSLSACSKMDEAAEVIHHMIGRLLPETRGAIFITKSSRNAEEMLVCWGGRVARRATVQPRHLLGHAQGAHAPLKR